MRKLVSLVSVLLLVGSGGVCAGIIPTLESNSKQIGFYPVSNEVSVYWNFDDAGDDRGRTLQLVLLNGVKLYTDFTIEFTGDFNWDYTTGLNRDHYMELGVVKPITSYFSINVQRVMSTFVERPVNQFGVRFRF